MKSIKVAVAGNPNSGKSTLINSLAGSRLQVGNWPGVTVERKTASIKHKDYLIEFIDLPGTYSLSPYSMEEIIARDFLTLEKPDMILNVVDSTNLERNLYLTIQLKELEIPVVMALNMSDELRKKGMKLNVGLLEELLGVKAVQTVATKKEGLSEIFDAVIETYENSQKNINIIKYSGEIEVLLENIHNVINQKHSEILERYPKRWIILKIIEQDEDILKKLNLTDTLDEIDGYIKYFKHTTGLSEDMQDTMSDARYAKASGVAKEVLSAIQKVKYDITEKLDKMLLNRFLSIPIFLLAMWIVFKIAFDFSSPFVDWIDGVFSGPFSKWVTSSLLLINAPEWTVSLVTDGIIAGTGFVLVFVPVIGVMMLLITFLEASGYMARVAFVMDRFMHTMGLHGKSFIPILLGFGCNVPSVYATRVLENERDRKLTTLLVPLMSCGARLPVYVVFIGAFFTKHSGTVLWSLYVLGIVVAILLGIILKKTMYKDESSIFIMELPPYRLPTLRDLFIHTWLKVKHFIVKAGTYILAVSIIVWFMLNLPWGVENKKDSLLGKVGQVVAPVFEPLGFGKWEAASSLITGLIAKEIVVSTMSQIYVQEENEEQEEDTGFGEDLKEIVVSFGSAVKESFENVFSTFKIASISADESEEDASSHTALRQELNKVFTPLSAYAFMAFVLLYWPCVVVAIAIRQEFGSWKLYGQAIMMHTVVAWIVSFIIYQGGLLLGLGG